MNGRFLVTRRISLCRSLKVSTVSTSGARQSFNASRFLFQTVNTKILLIYVIVIDDGSQRAQLVSLQHSVVVRVQIPTPQIVEISSFFGLFDFSQVVEIGECQLQVVFLAETMRSCRVDNRGEAVEKRGKRVGVQKVGHVGGNFSLVFSEFLDKQQVGENEGSPVTVHQ